MLTNRVPPFVTLGVACLGQQLLRVVAIARVQAEADRRGTRGSGSIAVLGRYAWQRNATIDNRDFTCAHNS